MDTAQDKKNPNISMFQVLKEHAIKGVVYSIFLAHALRSCLASTTAFSIAFNGVVIILAAWSVIGEIIFMMKRINKKLPPGLMGYPIWREIQAINSIASNRFIENLQRMKETFGNMFFAYSPIGSNVVLVGEDNLNWLFRQDRKGLTDVAWPTNIQMLLGPYAVANLVGKQHRWYRRLMEPYFSPSFVENYATVMDRTTTQELEKWCTGEFQSNVVFKSYALRLFYASSFGEVDESKVKSLHDDFTIWVNGFFTLTTRRIPGTAFDNAMKARERILRIIDQLIDDFKEKNPEGSKRATATIIGCFIYGKDPDNTDRPALSKDEIKDQILNLIFAGHDTTFFSISTILHHLSQNPAALAALTEEIDSFRNVDTIDCTELKNAPILNAVIFESLRLDPPVPFGFREVRKNALEKDMYKFDPGTKFNYSILLTNMDSDIYSNPDKFCMERFLPEGHPLYNKELDSKVDPRQGRSAYPVFGGGTHVCLGRAFGLLELRIILFRMLRHYRVEVKTHRRIFFPIVGWSVDFKLTKRKDE